MFGTCICTELSLSCAYDTYPVKSKQIQYQHLEKPNNPPMKNNTNFGTI